MATTTCWLMGSSTAMSIQMPKANSMSKSMVKSTASRTRTRTDYWMESLTETR